MFPTRMTLLANLLKIHLLEYCQTNISLTGSQFHWSWVCLLYSPYSSHPQISHWPKNAMFCFHWWLTIHQWTEFQYSIPLMSKFPVLSISLFSAESGQTSYRKVPCFTNKVLEWYKHKFQFTIHLDDKIRATVQLITYTVPQNCLSLFTISQITLNTVPFLSVLAQRLSFRFFSWGSSLE